MVIGSLCSWAPDRFFPHIWFESKRTVPFMRSLPRPGGEHPYPGQTTTDVVRLIRFALVTDTQSLIAPGELSTLGVDHSSKTAAQMMLLAVCIAMEPTTSQSTKWLLNLQDSSCWVSRSDHKSLVENQFSRQPCNRYLHRIRSTRRETWYNLTMYTFKNKYSWIYINIYWSLQTLDLITVSPSKWDARSNPTGGHIFL